MNAQAKLWGLTKTRFTEPSGADLGNISTAKEYLKIFTEATKNKTILATMGEKSYTYDETLDLDNNPNHFDSHSNLLIKRTDLPFTIIASKTGYLIESGSGLSMLVERKSDKKRFVIITMGNLDYDRRFDTPESLTKWALKEF
jgi:D-alanyl-D-alanine carboxypeptidase